MLSQFVFGCTCAIAIVLVQILLISRSFSPINEKVPCSGNAQPLRADENENFQRRSKRDRQRRLPTAIIIGARKGGTRALLDALALHPKVRAARREIHFFDQNTTYQLGTEWYRQQMPYSTADQITIEKSPSYLTNPLSAQRVYMLNPLMKLILIVRDPVVRTISDFTQVFYTKMERNKLQPRFEDVAFISNSTQIDTDYKPIRNSLYAEHLSHWLNLFPHSQLHIVDGDRFVAEPLKELRKVESFLSLPHSVTDDQLVYNPIKGFYCFRRRTSTTARCLGNSKGRAHVPISNFTKRRLARNFRPHNRRFFMMTNQHLSWQ
jgi:hypothetical protein